MDQFILYVPKTEAEFVGTKAVMPGAARSLVYWSNTLYEIVDGTHVESRILPIHKTDSSESGSENESPMELAIREIGKALDIHNNRLLKLESSNESLSTIKALFSPTLFEVKSDTDESKDPA